jgi:hypothetical protein
MDTNDRRLQVGLDQLLKIAEERKIILDKLKNALISDEIEKIKQYAKILCGLDGVE